MRLFILLTLLLIALANGGLVHASEQTQPSVEVLDGYRLRLSIPTSASPERIWALWEDVENWNKFDTLLEYSHLDQGQVFENGASGHVKARGANRTRFTLGDINHGISFTETLFVPLFQRIELKRHVETVPASDVQDAHTLFTHEVVFKGRLRFLIYAVAASSFKKELPLVMQRLREVAESLEASE